MKAISRRLDRFCYNHPNFGIPNLMKYIAIGNVVVFLGDMFTSGGFSWMVRFYPELILQGQVWRILTFVFAPVSTGGSSLFVRVLFFAPARPYFCFHAGLRLCGGGRPGGTDRLQAGNLCTAAGNSGTNGLQGRNRAGKCGHYPAGRAARRGQSVHRGIPGTGNGRSAAACRCHACRRQRQQHRGRGV